jgi:hypothetical protein
MKVRFHPLAERELIAAALYLDTEAGGGAEFLKSYETWEAQVREYPESCPVIGLEVRKGILSRFKYLIGYKIKGSGRSQHIRILYVRHFSQKRDDWTVRK